MTKMPSGRQRQTRQNRTFVPSKAVQSLSGLGGTHLKTIRSPGTKKRNALTSQSQPLNDIFEKSFSTHSLIWNFNFPRSTWAEIKFSGVRLDPGCCKMSILANSGPLRPQPSPARPFGPGRPGVARWARKTPKNRFFQKQFSKTFPKGESPKQITKRIF